MWTGRRKATRGFLAAAVAALAVPAIIVGWLGWLLLQSDRELDHQRVQERLTNAALLSTVFGPFRAGNSLDKIRWTADGRTLVFVTLDSPGSWRLMRVPAQGGQAEFDGLDFGTLSPLLSVPRMQPGGFNNFDLSQDGSRAIVSTMTVETYELWALDSLLPVVSSR